MKILIKNGRLIDPASGRDERGDLVIAGGRILALGSVPSDFLPNRVIDASGCIVAPGLVDLAARLREPGHEHEGMLESELNAAAAGDHQVAQFVAAGGGVDQPAVFDQDLHASFPARIDITAMRTAMPKVTWGKMTLWLPSATAEAISTPRLIGPGCITMASGLASCSLAADRP